MATDDDLVLGTATIGLTIDAPVSLSVEDRRRHLHVIGKTGTGKSTFLLSLLLQDLAAGRGFALLDPHGDLAQAVIDAVPPERTHPTKAAVAARLAQAAAWSSSGRRFQFHGSSSMILRAG